MLLDAPPGSEALRDCWSRPGVVQDIFAGLISLIFIIDGILPILRNFIEETIPLRSAMFETLLFVITFGGLAVKMPR